MLRINVTMGVAALLLLQTASSIAAEGDRRVIVAPSVEAVGIAETSSDEIYRTAASASAGEGQQLARSDLTRQHADQSESKSNAMTIEYPALALLAMAIISIAALSRRDGFRIDR